MPGRLAAIEQSTMPQTIATPKAYACSQPRMRGLPMSTGLSPDAVFVSMAQGYGTVGYLAVVTSATEDFPVVNVRFAGADAVLMEVDDGDPLDLHADLCRRREAGDLVATDIVPGARTVLVDGVPNPAALAADPRNWEPRHGKRGRCGRSAAAGAGPTGRHGAVRGGVMDLNSDLGEGSAPGGSVMTTPCSTWSRVRVSHVDCMPVIR